MLTNDYILLAMLRATLSHDLMEIEKLLPLEASAWNEVIGKASAHGVSGLLYSVVEQLPKSLRPPLEMLLQLYIKNYLQVDNVNFRFGTGASIHLGAASIQNIPEQAEKDIFASDNDNLKEDFKEYVLRLQKVLKEEKNSEKDKAFKDDRGWDVIFYGTYIRDYKAKIDLADGEEDTPEKHYGEICVM